MTDKNLITCCQITRNVLWESTLCLLDLGFLTWWPSHSCWWTIMQLWKCPLQMSQFLGSDGPGGAIRKWYAILPASSRIFRNTTTVQKKAFSLSWFLLRDDRMGADAYMCSRLQHWPRMSKTEVQVLKLNCRRHGFESLAPPFAHHLVLYASHFS